MSYDSAPDAGHIQKFAEEMRTFWAEQIARDTKTQDMMLMENKLTVAGSRRKKNEESPRGHRSGIGPIAVKEDIALLMGEPGLHVNPPTDKKEDKDKASEILEPWLAGARKRSQQHEPVTPRLPADLRVFHRCWSNVYPHPDLWTNDDYRKLVERLNASDDPQERQQIEREIQEFKRDHWPIRWSYVSPLSTWTIFGGLHYLPEVIELKRMSPMAIRAEYGDDAIGAPSATGGHPPATGGHPLLDVYVWANWAWCATVIGSKADPKLVRKYEHGEGCNPYILSEIEVLPENDKNLRWGGAFFHTEDTINSYDTILSDLAENHRRNTLTPLTSHVDKDTYQEDALVAGRPPPIDYEPGIIIPMFIGEELRLAPVPQINPQSFDLLREEKDLILRTMYRPVDRGEALSGTSNNLFTTQIQIADRRFNPATQALNAHHEGVALRLLRSVASLNRDFPDYPDEVFVYDQMGERGVIGVTPKDVKGWEHTIQARSSRAIPLDRLVQIQTAQAGQSVGLSRETTYEQDLGFENPRAEIKRRRLEDLDNAAFEQAVKQVQLRAGTLLSKATPQQLGRLTELQGMGGSPALEAVLSGQVPPQGVPPEGMAPGNFAQGMANVRRTGSPQMPQRPQQAVLG